MPYQTSRPPRLAEWLLRFSLHEVDVDIVLGDLEETYTHLSRRYSQREAKRWYWSQALRSIPLLFSRTAYWTLTMFKNYLKVAFRNLRKHKGYAFINVFGLAVGIAFCALIFLFIRDELTYDRFHENGDQIYRVHTVRFHPDGSLRGTNPSLPIPAGPSIKAEIPGIDQFVRFSPERHFMRYQDEAIQQPMLYADPTVFEVFSFPLLQGDPASALADRYSVVLTEEAALKFFGNENPMGKTLTIRTETVYEDFTVTGVAQNVPGNSTIQFDVLLPFEKLISTDRYRDSHDAWDRIAFLTYVSLDEQIMSAEVDAKLDAFHQQRYPNLEQEMRESGRWTGAGRPETFALQPLHDIHLSTVSDPLYSYILSGIALAILLIACINFMTLAIGRSASRGKEVGVRKVVGAQRRQVAGQFWGEALLMSGLGLLLGILLAEGFLPIFNDLAGKNLHFDYAANWTTLAMLAGLVLFTGLAAGGYPALVLSRFKPIEVLKNRLKLSGSNGFTKSLVVIQFALSVFLIIGTITMQKQMHYIQTRDLGYNKEQVVVVRNSGLEGRAVSQRFRDMVGQHSSILGISATGNKLGYRGSSGFRLEYEGERYNVDLISVEANFLDLMDIDLVQGRDFDPNLSTDSTDATIVNEAFLHAFNLTDPLGKPMPGFPPEQAPTIVGVAQDFNYQVLYQVVGPLMLSMKNFWGFRYTFVRISPDNIPETLAMLERTWTNLAPDVPFSYYFLDEDMQQHYRADQRWSAIINYASIFAVLIACLGLFGLVSLTVASRTKEVGIRKVLGAQTSGITLLLSKDFVKLVLIGVGIAVPAAYFAMQRWLENFAFRIDIGVGVFLLATALAVGIAFLTVSYQSIKAALANPVDSLRYE